MSELLSDFVTRMPPKHPSNVEPYFFIWCDEDGTNTGTTSDDGELQGETISSYTATVQTGLTKSSDNKGAVTVGGIAYGANTVVTVWLSGGTAGSDYYVTCQVVTSNSRTLNHTMIVPVR